MLICDRCSFGVVCTSDSWLYSFPAGKMDDTKGDPILHCWLDIPKTIVHYQNQDTGTRNEPDTTIEQQSLGELQVGLADLFQFVIGDDSNGRSDVTLVILKRNEQITAAVQMAGLIDDTDKSSKKSFNPEDILREFYCHRNILQSRSVVFKAMFSENWKEGASKEKPVVPIDDISPSAMEKVLRFIYTASFPDVHGLNMETISDITYASGKYQLQELKHWCGLVMISYFWSTSDRVKQLELADRHDSDQLKAVCVDHLSNDFGSAVDLFREFGRDDFSMELFFEVSQDAEDRKFDTAIDLTD